MSVTQTDGGKGLMVLGALNQQARGVSAVVPTCYVRDVIDVICRTGNSEMRALTAQLDLPNTTTSTPIALRFPN